VNSILSTVCVTPNEEMETNSERRKVGFKAIGKGDRASEHDDQLDEILLKK